MVRLVQNLFLVVIFGSNWDVLRHNFETSETFFAYLVTKYTLKLSITMINDLGNGFWILSGKLSVTLSDLSVTLPEVIIMSLVIQSIKIIKIYGAQVKTVFMIKYKALNWIFDQKCHIFSKITDFFRTASRIRYFSYLVGQHVATVRYYPRVYLYFFDRINSHWSAL